MSKVVATSVLFVASLVSIVCQRALPEGPSERAHWKFTEVTGASPGILGTSALSVTFPLRFVPGLASVTTGELLAIRRSGSSA